MIPVNHETTIWVTLSVINWNYGGIAAYNTTSSKWELATPGTTGGGKGTATSFLPEWTENFATNGNNQWIDL